MVDSVYVKKGGKITADGHYHTDNDGKVQAVTLKSGSGTGVDGLTVGLSYVDKVTGSGLDDTVRMDTVADKDFGVMSLGKGFDRLVLTNCAPDEVTGVTTHRLKLTSVEAVVAQADDMGLVTLDINGVGTFATNGSVNFMTSGRATSAKQTITYTEMVADTTVDLAFGKDLIIFQAGTTFSIIGGNLVASHPDQAGSVTFLNYASTASNLKITVLGDVTQTYAQWYAASEAYTATAITLSAIDISSQEANTVPGSNAGDNLDDFVTNVDEQTITVQLSRALVTGEQLLGSTDGGTTWTVVDTYTEGTTVGEWDVTLTEGTDDIVFKVRAPNGDYLPVDGEGGESLSQTYTLDQTAPDVGDLTFDSIWSDSDDPDLTDAVTNQSSGSVTFNYDGADLGTGERFQYSIDGGTSWLESVSGEGTTITVDGEGNSVTLDEINFTTVTNLRLRVIDAAGNETTSGEDGGSYISQTITYDNVNPTWGEGSNTLSLNENSTAAISLSNTASDTNGVTYALVTGGDAASYTINASTGALTRSSAANYEEPNVSDSVTIRATDDAGNTSDQAFTINIVNVDEAGTLTISGADYVQGTVLTANLSDIDGATSAETYQWYRDGETISGATSSTYTLGLDDIGAQIDVEVSYTDPQGSGKSASSSSTETVDALADQVLTVAQAVQYADAINDDHSGEDFVHDETEHSQGSFYVRDTAAHVVAAAKATLDKISADDGDWNDVGEDGNEIVIDNGTVGEDIAYGTEHDITMAQMDTLLNKGVVTLNDGALQAGDVYYDIHDFYTSVQAGQFTERGQSIIAEAQTVTAYGNAVGQQIDMLAFSRDLIIYGRAGDDNIYTGTGDNFAAGGTGADLIIGDVGSDLLLAGERWSDADVTGSDVANFRSDFGYGQDWALSTSAWANSNTTSFLDTSEYDAAIYDELGGTWNSLSPINGVDTDLSPSDTLYGGAGSDYLFADGEDTLYGGDDNDVLFATDWDTLNGDAGNDVLVSWGQYNTLAGGAGDDTYYLNWADFNVVTENGGEGTDTVVVDGVNWTLGDNVENLTNSSWWSATLTGNALGNVIRAGGEGDHIVGGGGADVLHGNSGYDYIEWGGLSGADTSDVTVYGYGGNDLIDSTHNALGDDYIDAGDGNDTVYAGAGNDILIGGVGNDTLAGETGIDTYVFEASRAANGTDTLVGFVAGAGGDVMDFSAFLGSGTYSTNNHIVSDGLFGNINGQVWELYSAAADSSADVNEAGEIAARFTTITGGGKAVVISGEDTSANNTAYIWFVQDANSDGNIDSTEVSLVGTMATFQLGQFVSGNFDLVA